MFSRLIGRLRPSPDFSKPPRRGELIGDALATVMQSGLPPDFQRVGDLLWVGRPENHVRHLFQFKALKGLTFSACWGVSVDFVPVLKSSGGLGWKRTARSAHFDLCIDPVDTTGTVPRWCSFVSNEGDRWIEGVALSALEAARSDWRKIGSPRDVVDCFETRSKMSFSRFSLSNYVQTDIAWGLCLISLGEHEKGQRHLDAFCRRFEVPADDAILAKARDQAIAIAQGQ